LSIKIVDIEFSAYEAFVEWSLKVKNLEGQII